MGLFDALFGNRKKPRGEYKGTYKLLNAYAPRFTSHQGSLYESELVRAAINARATHISKLAVEMIGSAKPALQNKMKKELIVQKLMMNFYHIIYVMILIIKILILQNILEFYIVLI